MNTHKKSFHGLAVGLLFSGIILGIFLGSSAGYLCTKYIEKDQLHNWGWRIPFILGGILGFNRSVFEKIFNRNSCIYTNE